MERFDVAVVGAGPIGLELAVALKRERVRYVHVDAGQIGATIERYPPQTRFFSSPERIALAGVPLQTADQSKATREEYLAYLRCVAQQFDLRVRTFERVVDVSRVEDGFVLRTRRSRGPGDGGPPREYAAGGVVLCSGNMDGPRRLGVEGEDLPHASHSFEGPHTYFRQRVLIVGGKNSAVEAALRCCHAGADVALSYRRSELDKDRIKYWLYPEISALIKEGRIAFHGGTIPARITPGGAELVPVGGGPARRVEADFVLLLTGYAQDPALFETFGVEVSGPARAPVFDSSTMRTNVPGVYVAGTATAGTPDRTRVFIENSHVHVERIVAALAGRSPPRTEVSHELPES